VTKTVTHVWHINPVSIGSVLGYTSVAKRLHVYENKVIMRERVIILKCKPGGLHRHIDVVESQGELLGTVAYPDQPDKVALFTRALKRIRGAKQKYSPERRLLSLKQAEDIVIRGMEVIERDRFSAAEVVLNTHLNWWNGEHKVSLSKYVHEKTERLKKVEKSLSDDGFQRKGQYRFEMTPHYFFKEIWTPSKTVLSLS